MIILAGQSPLRRDKPWAEARGQEARARSARSSRRARRSLRRVAGFMRMMRSQMALQIVVRMMKKRPCWFSASRRRSWRWSVCSGVAKGEADDWLLRSCVRRARTIAGSGPRGGRRPAAETYCRGERGFGKALPYTCLASASSALTTEDTESTERIAPCGNVVAGYDTDCQGNFAGSLDRNRGGRGKNSLSAIEVDHLVARARRWRRWTYRFSNSSSR